MAEKKIAYSRKPDELTIDEWQSELRKQFARDQKFRITNIGTHPVFSDFKIFNPASGKTYKVSIRDNIRSFNYCSCPDFTITALGTCKHIEYLLYYFSKYKKFQKYLSKPYKPEYSSISIHYGRERKVKLKKHDHAALYANEEQYFDHDGYLKPGMLEKLPSFIHSAVSVDPGIRIYPDVDELIEQTNRDLLRRRTAEGLFQEGKESKVFEGLIRANLYPYQKEGVKRIIEAGRILLADDMGLGKTIQALAATEIFAKYLNVGKVLIICPTSLKFQWKREIEKFTNREAIVVEGLIHTRKDLYASDSFYKIISYGVCRSDLEFINNANADLIIIDEAQRIKNWKTQTAQSVKKILSEYAIVLTGTPLENRIDDLHSIVEYIDRYRLGPLFRFLDAHQVLDEKGKLKGYRDLRSIHKTLGDILLRRTKKEIADQLHGRMDKNYFVEMTKEQISDHDSYYDAVSKLVRKWIRLGFLSEEERQQLLTCLNCMRMVCDSTYILNRREDHNTKIKELSDLLGDLLEDKENKIVIFSQWKRMFELVIQLLEKLNIPYEYLNGDLPAKERKRIIEKFQETDEIKIFLSTDAGGVGVNLQSANILINIDLPWNPAVLEQRVGRIFRIGQKKHVNVYNLISKNSIEHRILYLLDFKKSVFTGVIEEEGKDEVMLEGFMESVRALTEVFTDGAKSDMKPDKNNTESFVNAYSQIKSRETEINFRPEDSNKMHENGFDAEEREIQMNQSLFNLFRNSIRRILKKIFT
jgi:SNF2 family DNA or RNA helicase